MRGMRFSARQHRAIDLMRQWGKLERYEGGFWGEPGLATRPSDYVGTPTIIALYSKYLVAVTTVNGVMAWNGFPHKKPKFAYPTPLLKSIVVKAEQAEAEDAS